MGMMWELVIAWSSGEVDIFSYDTRESAEWAGEGMKMAFGEQITWYGTRRKNF